MIVIKKKKIKEMKRKRKEKKRKEKKRKKKKRKKKKRKEKKRNLSFGGCGNLVGKAHLSIPSLFSQLLCEDSQGWRLPSYLKKGEKKRKNGGVKKR